MSKRSDPEAKNAVLNYLNKQNRPYSAIDVFNNLHKEHGKTAVVRCLEELAQEGSIIEKVYNKQKVYSPNQEQYQNVDEKELKEMDCKIVEFTDKVKSEQDHCKSLDTELHNLNNSLATEAASNEIQVLTDKIQKLQEKLHTLKNASNSVSPEERKTILTAREKYVKEWRKRKRIATDILGSILESYPKSKKELYEDAGVEPDEDYGVKPPQI